ncbi:hypothetical protein PR048_017006 [Dryococelus australis]|uniref:Uncharacterized protein n=1 Tax=Dryococelus australis TaxID=614101 RepID=A0ABQ9H8H0_9NEOP|nr:hypothetical protein PR048_017006 [Dryococelus australis]
MDVLKTKRDGTSTSPKTTSHLKATGSARECDHGCNSEHEPRMKILIPRTVLCCARRLVSVLHKIFPPEQCMWRLRINHRWEDKWQRRNEIKLGRQWRGFRNWALREPQPRNALGFGASFVRFKVSEELHSSAKNIERLQNGNRGKDSAFLPLVYSKNSLRNFSSVRERQGFSQLDCTWTPLHEFYGSVIGLDSCKACQVNCAQTTRWYLKQCWSEYGVRDCERLTTGITCFIPKYVVVTKFMDAVAAYTLGAIHSANFMTAVGHKRTKLICLLSVSSLISASDIPPPLAAAHGHRSEVAIRVTLACTPSTSSPLRARRKVKTKFSLAPRPQWCGCYDYSPPTKANRARFQAGSPPGFRIRWALGDTRRSRATRLLNHASLAALRSTDGRRSAVTRPRVSGQGHPPPTTPPRTALSHPPIRRRHQRRALDGLLWRDGCQRCISTDWFLVRCPPLTVAFFKFSVTLAYSALEERQWSLPKYHSTSSDLYAEGGGGGEVVPHSDDFACGVDHPSFAQQLSAKFSLLWVVSASLSFSFPKLRKTQQPPSSGRTSSSSDGSLLSYRCCYCVLKMEAAMSSEDIAAAIFRAN